MAARSERGVVIPEWATRAAEAAEPHDSRCDPKDCDCGAEADQAIVAEALARVLGPEREALEAEVERLTRERDQARALAEDACRRYNESLRVVTCAFCGVPYPPDTPASGAAVLAEHIKVCARHPMREAERERDGAREALRGMLVVYEELHARHDLEDFGCTTLEDLARAIRAREKGGER